MPFSVDGYNAFGPESLSAIASVVAVLWLFGTLPVSRMRASELVAASALGFVIGITFISSESSFQGVAAILGLTFSGAHQDGHVGACLRPEEMLPRVGVDVHQDEHHGGGGEDHQAETDIGHEALSRFRSYSTVAA